MRNRKKESIQYVRKCDIPVDDMRIRVQSYCGIQAVHQYLMRIEVSQDVDRSFRSPIRPGTEQALRKVGRIGAQIVIGILPLKGVEFVSLKRYEVHIAKADMFTWDEIEPEIRKVMLGLFDGRRKGKVVFEDITKPGF